MTHTQTEPTVEQVLAELRETFGHGTYVSVESKGIYYPSDYGEEPPLMTAFVNVGRKQFYGLTLSEAMTQVRNWKQEQS